MADQQLHVGQGERRSDNNHGRCPASLPPQSDPWRSSFVALQPSITAQKPNAVWVIPLSSPHHWLMKNLRLLRAAAYGPAEKWPSVGVYE